MNFVIRFTTLLTLLALGACGGGGDSKDTTPPPGGGTPPPPPAATAPTITMQPAAQSVAAPATTTLTVTATGTAPLAYQWRSSADGTTWTDIAGATSASFDTGATSDAMNGRRYSVVVSNAAGNVISNSVQLTVTPPPPAGGGGGGPSGEFPHAANPAAIEVTRTEEALTAFDVTSSADATVQVPGSASDIVVQTGVTVTVGAPGDAFLEDQSLAVRPVALAALDAEHPLPFQSVAGAFDLGAADTTAPELQARDFVRITFTLTTDALTALGGTPVIFSSRSDGTQLHLVPVFANPDGTFSTLTLTTHTGHLGVFGIATLSSEQAVALALAWPEPDDLQLESSIAPASYELRKSALAAPSPAKTRVVRIAADDTDDWGAQMRARVDAYYNDVVEPALSAASAAGADYAQITDATQKVLAWEKMRQLLGVEEQLDADVREQVQDVTRQGLEKAMAACTANRDAASAVQALGMLRRLILLGGDTDVTADSVLGVCGRSRYDLDIAWQQVRSDDLTLSTDFETTAFTSRQLSSVTTAGRVHVAPDANPELSSVTYDETSTSVNECTDTSRAWYCTDTKEKWTAHDTTPEFSACGTGFYGGYNVTRWNLDARGAVTGPQLEIRFQNSYGCAPTSFIITTRNATHSVEYPLQNRTETSTVGRSDTVNMVTWNGSARVGTSTRIVRSSQPITGENVQPGSVTRWTTRLDVKVTEVPATN